MLGEKAVTARAADRSRNDVAMARVPLGMKAVTARMADRSKKNEGEPRARGMIVGLDFGGARA